MTKRIERVNELIKREVSQILLRDIEFPKNTLVTITRVETSGNLIETRVYFSVLPDSQFERVLKLLNFQIYGIQQQINRKFDMRYNAVVSLSVFLYRKLKSALSSRPTVRSLVFVLSFTLFILFK